jgi:methylthioribose-1-phosphate isomerase
MTDGEHDRPVSAVRAGAAAWHRRRPRGSVPRRHRITINLDDAEYAAVLAHAEAARLAPAAYVAAVSVAPKAAAGERVGDDDERAEWLLHLLGLHRQMRGAAVNLNQATAKLHALGEPVGELPAIAAHVRRVTTAVDDLIAVVAGERA